MAEILTDEQLNNMQLFPDKIYEIDFIIPLEEFADRTVLQDKLTQIHKDIIFSKEIQYITSRLSDNIFTVQFKLRPEAITTVQGLGVIPFLVAFTVILALSLIGLTWSVREIREVSTPVVAITKNLLPIAIIIGAIILLPKILEFIPKRKEQ